MGKGTSFWIYDRRWVQVPYDVFRSWTGRRLINGVEFHGPVYFKGSRIKYGGQRYCACNVCIANLRQPSHR